MEDAAVLVVRQRFGQDRLDDRARARVRARGRDPRLGPVGQRDGEVLGGVEEQLLLGPEVVLDEPDRHPGLGRDIAQAGLVQPPRSGHAQQGLGDLPAALLVVDKLRHLLTVSPYGPFPF